MYDKLWFGRLTIDDFIDKTPKNSNPRLTTAITNAINAIKIAIFTPFICYDINLDFLFFHV